jgi:hypothetical protein
MTYRPRVLLADATVLYSALIYRGLENTVLFSGDYIFVTTESTPAKIYRIAYWLKKALT